MKALVISDNHREADILTAVVAKMGPQVDVLIHCGDSELDPHQDPMRNFQAVKGNNDYGLDYPKELLLPAGSERIFVSHGHLQKVNFSLTPLMLTGQSQKASIICYGHTHQLGVAQDKGMLILNPGSISFPRGQYAQLGGTFAVVEAQSDRFIVDFYNRQLEALPALHREFGRGEGEGR